MMEWDEDPRYFEEGFEHIVEWALANGCPN